AVDYPEKEERFEMVYLLLSLANNLRLKIKVNISEENIIDSLSNIYTNSDWLEREVYDMFGIYFSGHKDLRRILTDFGFEGSPLRKDFPLTGFVEVEFNEEYQKVMYKPVELTQAYRDNSYNNPWMDKIEADTFNYLNKKDK
ncbi:MAG: NADH-quinone oxidoreductase subunit C, partial [Alphaproteobacteria bacterium]|nr:NADH-quinone oxidoreductase subunit C [Alphaproteobacteria bacterium]